MTEPIDPRGTCPYVRTYVHMCTQTSVTQNAQPRVCGDSFGDTETSAPTKRVEVFIDVSFHPSSVYIYPNDTRTSPLPWDGGRRGEGSGS